MISALALAAVLSHARGRYLADIAAMASLTGRDVAYDYVDRLSNDIDALSSAPPSGSRADYVARVATLDDDVVEQYLARAPHPLAPIRGFGETLVRSSADGTLQPLAVYVPASYDPKHPAPLVVFLHGSGGSESALLAQTGLAQLADSTGSIVIAPYGRGYSGFRGSATPDIYDALAVAKRAFAIDPRRRYLAGYSMGGFSIFRAGSVHPNEWDGLMCISGGLSGYIDADAALRELNAIPLYVLTGKNDAVVPNAYTTQSAAYLRYYGMSVSYYRQSDGTHDMESLLPILDRAWDDMHRGIVRDSPADFPLTEVVPTLPSGLNP
jgi:phospholipase/carboxylesterase